MYMNLKIKRLVGGLAGFVAILALFVAISLPTAGVVHAVATDDGNLGVDLDGGNVTDLVALDSSSVTIEFIDRSTIKITPRSLSDQILTISGSGLNVTYADFFPASGFILLKDGDIDGNLQYNNNDYGMRVSDFENNDAIVNEMNRVDNHLGQVGLSTFGSLRFKWVIRYDTVRFDEYFVLLQDGSWGTHSNNTGVDVFSQNGLRINSSQIENLTNFNNVLTPDNNGDLFVLKTNEANQVVYSQCDTSNTSSLYKDCVNTDQPHFKLKDGYGFDDILSAETALDALVYVDSSGNETDYPIFGGNSESVTTSTDLGTGADPGETAPTCESESPGGDLPAWLACTALYGADKALGALDSIIDSMLTIRPAEYNNDQYIDAWRFMRNISTFLIVGTALFMIISNALDFGIFSNYTIKRYIPRFLIGVISIQFSWVLSVMFVQFINEIGDGLAALIYTPFNGASELKLASIFNATEAGTAGIFATGTGIALTISLGFVGVLGVAYTAIIGLIGAFITLVIRKIVIVFLILVSPLAIAAWMAPGDDKLWKSWRTLFVSLLLMYPAITGLIAVGKVFASVVNASGSTNTVVSFLLAFVAYVTGYIAIPFLIKRFLGALNQLTGTMNDRTKGLLDKGRKQIDTWKEARGQNRKTEREMRRARKSQEGGFGGALASMRLRTDAGGPVFGRGHSPLKATEKGKARLGLAEAAVAGHVDDLRKKQTELAQQALLSRANRELDRGAQLKVYEDAAREALSGGNQVDFDAAMGMLMRNRAGAQYDDIMQAAMTTEDLASRRMAATFTGANFGDLRDWNPSRTVASAKGGTVAERQASIEQQRLDAYKGASDQALGKVAADDWRTLASKDAVTASQLAARALSNEESVKGMPAEVKDTLKGFADASANENYSPSEQITSINVSPTTTTTINTVAAAAPASYTPDQYKKDVIGAATATATTAGGTTTTMSGVTALADSQLRDLQTSLAAAVTHASSDEHRSEYQKLIDKTIQPEIDRRAQLNAASVASLGGVQGPAQLGYVDRRT